MKRFVYVPSHLGDDKSLEEAKKLSHESKLQIMVGTEDDGISQSSICIIAMPSKKSFLCDGTVESGFIHSIDIEDEFLLFDESIHLVASSPSGEIIHISPKLREKHLARFRSRFYEPGKYSFVCQNNNKEIYFEGSFEVV
jgi:hypothetical protein